MAQRTEISYICNACKADIPKGGKRFVLHGVQYDFDLCLKCHTSFRKDGTPVPYTCQKCDFVGKSASGLTVHTNKKHDRDPRP